MTEPDSTENRPYVVITGASRGLGSLFAHAFAKRGRNLFLAARSQDALEDLGATLKQRYAVDVRILAVDLSAPGGVSLLCQATHAIRVAGLVNNAGFGLGGSFTSTPPARVAEMLGLNIQALTLLAHHFLPRLRQTRGFLVNVASQAAFQPMPFMAAYAASKAYVLHLSEALTREEMAHQVHVMALCPGPTGTDFFDAAAIQVDKTRLSLQSPEAVIAEAMRALEHKRSFVVTGWQNKVACFALRLISRDRATQICQRLLGH